MNQLPFFSIIVVALNATNSIEETICSILAQSFTDYEIIVKDGQSIDDTLNKIPEDPRIKVYVSKDNGIYDAMNQALAKSRGQFVNFLNCGDCYANPNVLKTIYSTATKYAVPCVIYGNLAVNEGVCVQVRKLTKFSLFRRPLNHQTCFIDSSIFRKYGFFDLNYKVLADYEFAMRTWFTGVTYVYVDSLLITYLGNGFSVAKNNLWRKSYELRKLRLKYYPGIVRCLYGIAIMFSLVHIRLAINSPKCPLLIKRVYRTIVSFIIEKINKSSLYPSG